MLYGLSAAALAWVLRLSLLDRATERRMVNSSAPWPPLPEGLERGAARRDPGPTAGVSGRAGGEEHAPDVPAEPAWVPPDDTGSCPGTHPVKAKLRSNLYHLEGMAAHARTCPDRCYESPEAAEADGFRRARR